MKKNRLLVIIVFVIVILIAVIVVVLNNNKTSVNNFISENKFTSSFENHSTNSQIPSNFSLPFNINDIDQQNGEINPIGIVRFSQDQVGIGHSGLDVPLFQKSEIYAVSDGEIILIDSAGDPWGGMKIYQLLEKTGEGEGWIFNYEHVTPVSGIEVGKNVKRGDLIANKTAQSSFYSTFSIIKSF